MPGNSTTSQEPQKVFQIKDFTAGIVTDNFAPNVNAGVASGVPSNSNVSFTPLTYGCMGLQNGGLLLGPTVYGAQSFGNGYPTGMTFPSVTGVVNQGFLNGLINYYIIVSGIETSTGFGMDSLFQSQGSTTSLLFTYTSGRVVTGYVQTLPFVTTLFNSGYFEAICWTSCLQSGTGADHVYYTTGANGSLDVGRLGYIITANGRIWLLESLVTAAENPYFSTISFNDPTTGDSNNNFIHAASDQGNNLIIDYDSPATYSYTGQIASGQMLLVKNNIMGGVLVIGDIFNPTATVANAVQGSNGAFGQASVSPLGLVYFSNQNGAYSWNGGAASTLLSPTLAAEYILGPNKTIPGDVQIQPLPASVNMNNYYMYNCIFFSGGYFFNTITSSWWQLPPYLGQGTGAFFSPQFFVQTTRNFKTGDFQTLYIGSPSTTNDIVTTDYVFDVTSTDGSDLYSFTPPTSFFSSFLQTNPIQIQANDMVEIQQIDIVIQGTGTLFVGITSSLINIDREIVIDTNTADTYRRFPILMPSGFITDIISIQLGWLQAPVAFDTATPIVSEIDIYYVDRYPVPKL